MSNIISDEEQRAYQGAVCLRVHSPCQKNAGHSAASGREKVIDRDDNIRLALLDDRGPWIGSLVSAASPSSHSQQSVDRCGHDDPAKSGSEGNSPLGTDSRHPNLLNEIAWLYMDLGMPRDAEAALDNHRQLVKSSADALRDAARLMLLRNQPEALPKFLADNALLVNSEPGIAVDSMVLQESVLRLPVVGEVTQSPFSQGDP